MFKKYDQKNQRLWKPLNITINRPTLKTGRCLVKAAIHSKKKKIWRQGDVFHAPKLKVKSILHSLL